jgi:hypothetical protein
MSGESLTCAYCTRTPKRLIRGVACPTCYARLRNQGRLGELPITSPGPSALCNARGCRKERGHSGAKDYCFTHYQRLKNTGSLKDSVLTMPDEDRFWLLASARGACDCGCACERWRGGINKSGYGHFYWRGKTWLAHRVSWIMANKREIPEGLWVDHVFEKGCVHRDCVRADHLEAVTPGQNAQRAQRNFEASSRGGTLGGAVKGRHLTLRQRFLEKVSETPCPCGCACKRWLGTVNKHTGYGNFSTVRGKTDMAHRVAWELANGEPVPEGLVIDHVAELGCVHRDCVHPGHLEAITRKENARRARR